MALCSNGKLIRISVMTRPAKERGHFFLYLHCSSHEDGADSNLSTRGKLQLEYGLYGNHEDVNVAESAKDALDDCKLYGWKVARLLPQ